MTDDDDGLSVGRRDLLVGVPAAGVALAGCNEALDRLGDDGEPGTEGETDSPTDYGYGGSPTATLTASAAAAATDTDESEDAGTNTPDSTGTSGGTETSTGTQTETGTPTTTATGSPADDYGLQAYGQYGYGG